MSDNGSESTPLSRREFVSDAAKAAAAFTIVPRHVLGRGFQAPSDTLNIACIGVGGKGRSDVDGIAKENVYALCDVDLRSAESAFTNYPKAKRYREDVYKNVIFRGEAARWRELGLP